MKYTSFETAFGWVAVSASEQGLAALILPRKTEKEVLEALYKGLKGPVTRNDKYFEQTANDIRDYFAGKFVKFEATIDWSVFTPFQAKVLKVVKKIPYGETKTYEDIAKAIGCPGGARAVGGALKRNRIPVIIPCHRVILSSGAVGGFTGGEPGLKNRMLNLEKN